MLWQRIESRLIFGKPTRIRNLPPGPFAGEYKKQRFMLPLSDSVALEGWSAQSLNAPPQHLLIYFGGRNEHVIWAPDMLSYLGHWSVYAVNYRGFGGSGGHPGEASAKADALHIYDAVLQNQTTMPRTIALAGRSLGTSVALALAARRRTDKLVLLSPFDSLGQVLQEHYRLRHVRRMLTQAFDCRADAERVSAASAVLLAEDDQRIPHPRSTALWQALRQPARLEIVPGTNHQSLPRSPLTQTRIASFLNT